MVWMDLVRMSYIPVGFANAWIEEIKHTDNNQVKSQLNVQEYTDGNLKTTTLQIAEFSILENYRGMGLGKQCYYQLIAIGKQKKVARIVAEVDSGIPANLFWRKVMTYSIIDESKRRNLYWSYC